ncbi:hypothetical protein EG68_04741 [Paragonimus skrjabini miyazakii]|uniref:Uncharacterized protein n=1 Tax=Paragonimus skrjabini miyazakii TaxID=59628 RepID=A0A8S9Z566_9TREM|nr:hypothetical protein EG68_04741 [Paragonimus skrjabini miyazakii]
MQTTSISTVTEHLLGYCAQSATLTTYYLCDMNSFMYEVAPLMLGLTSSVSTASHPTIYLTTFAYWTPFVSRFEEDARSIGQARFSIEPRHACAQLFSHPANNYHFGLAVNEVMIGPRIRIVVLSNMRAVVDNTIVGPRLSHLQTRLNITPRNKNSVVTTTVSAYADDLMGSILEALLFICFESQLPRAVESPTFFTPMTKAW